MAKTELMLLTQEGINALANVELKKEVQNFYTAGQGISNARWIMAQAIYNVVTDELFEDDFDSDSEFYSFVGLKKANASQLVNAVDFMKRNGFDFNVYSVGKAYTLSTLTDDEFNSFMDYCNENGYVTTAMSDKALQELVKAWKNPTVVEEQTVEAEAEAEAEQATEFDREGFILQIVNDMKNFGISIEELTEYYNR